MGAGKSCDKKDHIDAKPSVDLASGIRVATSRECVSCSLVFPGANTTSTVSMTRDGNTLVITPFSPLTATFNGRQAVFREVRIYYPAPIKVEGVQADAVVQFVDEGNIEIFVPIGKSAGNAGTSFGFLSNLVSNLDVTTSEGLGIVDPDTKKYVTTTPVTGQNWSLTNLVTPTDPYFTWVDGKLEQYTRMDWGCDRYIGWRATAGSQIIYFQNPVPVSDTDINKLTTTIGGVRPEDVITTLANPLYSPGEAKNCPPVPIKLKLPTFDSNKGMADFIQYVIVVIAAILGIVAALAFMRSQGIQGAVGMVRTWMTPRKPGGTVAAPTAAAAPSPGLSSALSAANVLKGKLPGLLAAAKRK